MTAVRRQLAQPKMIMAVVCVVLATGLAIAAHMVDDRLLPARSDTSFDLSRNLSSVDLIEVGVILLACVLAAGALRPVALGAFGVGVGSLCLLTASSWFALLAVGDLVGLSTRACAPGESIDMYHNMCVPSPLADRIQLPLHIGVVILLLLTLVLSVLGFARNSAALYRERPKLALLRRDQPQEVDAQEQYLYEQHLLRQQRSAQRRGREE
jgi:hypothetical protein